MNTVPDQTVSLKQKNADRKTHLKSSIAPYFYFLLQIAQKYAILQK